jgi:hypothetical protein
MTLNPFTVQRVQKPVGPIIAIVGQNKNTINAHQALPRQPLQNEGAFVFHHRKRQ